MKSAYELAMERLEKSNPDHKKLTEAQIAQISDIDIRYKAKIAEREVFLGGLIATARATNAFNELPELEEQLAREVRRLRDQCEDEKEKVRNQA